MDRESTIEAVNDKFREISTETIMFHQTVANVLGLHITDHKCLEFIYRLGPMPAGRLCELTGLTTGAVTGVIDRLERAGYVRRTSDPRDRRRTIVEPARNKKLERRIHAIFRPLHDSMHRLLSSYSDSELNFLLSATTEMLEQTRKEAKKLRSIEK